MAFDRRSGNHAFDFDAGVCQRRGMSREQYEDNGKPPCTGRKPATPEHLQVPEE
jgi:hypothetical protein